MATCSMDSPRSCAYAAKRSIRSKSALSSRCVWMLSREPSGAGSPRRYLPVSSPYASGKYGSSPTPTCSHAGTRSSSAERSYSEYLFCAETNGVVPAVYATQSASTTCHPERFDEPR
jgi:hypothetical protein